MPPAWTYRSRCLRVCPGVVAVAALGCTCRICWRTCLTCLFPTRSGVYRERLRRTLAWVDRGHQDPLHIRGAVDREGPGEEDRRLVKAVVTRHHQGIDELCGGQRRGRHGGGSSAGRRRREH